MNNFCNKLLALVLFSVKVEMSKKKIDFTKKNKNNFNFTGIACCTHYIRPFYWVIKEVKIRKVNCKFCHDKWHPGNSGISAPLEIAEGTYFHVQRGTKTNLIFLPADGEASLSLLPSLASVQSSIVQPENTYCFILKVTYHVWESQKKLSINFNNNYHQCLFL